LLCAPKYLAGDMTLGTVVQASAAFVAVQAASNWLADNYGRLVEWATSASRVGSLLASLDRLNEAVATNEYRPLPVGYQHVTPAEHRHVGERNRLRGKLEGSARLLGINEDAAIGNQRSQSL
jgi:hypothetical protein